MIRPAYLIDESMLGPSATEGDARRMVGILNGQGYLTAYGRAAGNQHPYADAIPQALWDRALEEIRPSREEEPT